MRRLVALAVALGACSSLELQGGRTVRAGDEPAGTSAGAWITADCRDARGGAVEESSRVFLVQTAKGGLVAVEARPAYDSIVMEHGRVQGNERVFRVTFTGDDPVVGRELRLPPAGPGWLLVTSGGSRYRAITCRLDPVPSPAAPSASAPAPSAGAASPVRPLAPAASGASPRALPARTPRW